MTLWAGTYIDRCYRNIIRNSLTIYHNSQSNFAQVCLIKRMIQEKENAKKILFFFFETHDIAHDSLKLTV